MSQEVNWTFALNLKHKDFLKTFLNSWTDTDMNLMNASVSPWSLLMPFLIPSDSHSLPHCLLPVTRVCLPPSANDSLVLSKYRWTLIVFYSESLSSGVAPTFLSPPNGSWCVVFAVDLCMGGALWFTELWHCLSSRTREADCGSLCVFQVSLRSAHHPSTHTCPETLSCTNESLQILWYTLSFCGVIQQEGCYCCNL